MTEKIIQLDIVTPSGDGFSAEVSYLQIPAANGLMGILANHAPLMTTIEMGTVKYTVDGNDRYLAVSEGFAEVKDNKVTVLASFVNLAEDIDLDRAQAAYERAEARLNENADGLDVNRAKKAMAKANCRINAAANLKK